MTTFDETNARRFNVFLDGKKLLRCFKVKVDDRLATSITAKAVPAQCLVGYEPDITIRFPKPADDAVRYKGLWAHWISGNVQFR